nr:MAG TPA: hypothetical protein [Caudoviricetes sp.]
MVFRFNTYCVDWHICLIILRICFTNLPHNIICRESIPLLLR